MAKYLATASSSSIKGVIELNVTAQESSGMGVMPIVDFCTCQYTKKRRKRHDNNIQSGAPRTVVRALAVTSGVTV